MSKQLKYKRRDELEAELKELKSKSCETCIKKPKEGESFSFECGECCHFYSDNWESKMLNKIQEAEIKKHIVKINTMTFNELRSCCQKWHLAEQDLDETVFKWVLRGMDVKMAELMERADISPLVILSDLRAGEI